MAEKPILVTGTAGFIGSHVALRLLADGHRVVGVDDENEYYDVALKRARLARFLDHPAYEHVQGNISEREVMHQLFDRHRPGKVIHLAAQAGVRYAAENPHVYVSSNVTGMLHVLEGCRQLRIEHLVFASSSSVYGASQQLPYSEHNATDHPVSLYAATKKANELMAHSYAHLYGIPSTGLRFFTVYGPWGRPDMAPMLFAKAIMAGEPIKVFNRGNHRRSFTYVDDVVEGVVGVLDRPPAPDNQWNASAPDPALSGVAPYRLYNIGNQRSVALLDFIQLLERALGRSAELRLLPKVPGDVEETASDVSGLADAISYEPPTSIETGVARFVEWSLDYFHEVSGMASVADR